MILKHIWTGLQALSAIIGVIILFSSLVYGIYHNPIILIPVGLFIAYNLGKFLNELL
jgi:hypothetical protein